MLCVRCSGSHAHAHPSRLPELRAYRRYRRLASARADLLQCGHGAFIKSGRPARSPSIIRDEQMALDAVRERYEAGDVPTGGAR
jgi:hypothetical protein